MKNITQEQLLNFAQDVLQVEQQAANKKAQLCDFATVSCESFQKNPLRIKEQTPHAKVIAFQKKDES